MTFLGSHWASCYERPSGIHFDSCDSCDLCDWAGDNFVCRIYLKGTLIYVKYRLYERWCSWFLIGEVDFYHVYKAYCLLTRDNVAAPSSSKLKNETKVPQKRKCSFGCFPETFAMGDELAEGEAKLVPSSTRDLLQKLNRSIKSVEQEMLLQQAAVHMSNLKVLIKSKMNQKILRTHTMFWVKPLSGPQKRGVYSPVLEYIHIYQKLPFLTDFIIKKISQHIASYWNIVCIRKKIVFRGTTKVRNSGLGPDPDQSAKNGPE